MQGVRNLSEGGLRLEVASAPLTIDGGETTERKIERLITENPVIIFGKRSCCMCHVMKNLLARLGVHPAVIELEEAELGALAAHDSHGDGERGGVAPPSTTSSTAPAPAVFIGRRRVGGLESLMGLHLSGQLVPLLRDVGALWM